MACRNAALWIAATGALFILAGCASAPYSGEPDVVYVPVPVPVPSPRPWPDTTVVTETYPVTDTAPVTRNEPIQRQVNESTVKTKTRELQPVEQRGSTRPRTTGTTTSTSNTRTVERTKTRTR